MMPPPVTQTGAAMFVRGAIDRSCPDPASAYDIDRRWIGSVAVSWAGCQVRSAAILRVNTGRGAGDPPWGPSVLVLRWIGDPPPPDVCRAVYDLVSDGGPGERAISAQWAAVGPPEPEPDHRGLRS